MRPRYGETRRAAYRRGFWDGFGLLLALEAGIFIVVMSTLAVALT